MYKIAFNMTSPICYIDLPVFDAILAYCVYNERRETIDVHTPTGKEVFRISTVAFPYESIPLKMYDNKFYLASYMFTDGNIESVDSWKKRWEEKYDYLADFGKARRRIDTGSGRFKSYNIPLVIHSVKRAWFYFDGNPTEIERLIVENLRGFGKKVDIGFGWFSSAEIEEVNEPEKLFIRPLPNTPEMIVKLMSVSGVRITPGFGRILPPYWLREDEMQLLKPIIAVKSPAISGG